MSRTAFICFCAAAAVLLCAASPGFAQQSEKAIVRPQELKNEEQIRRFILSVLQDRTERPDPFVGGEQRIVADQQVTYEVEQKPRPESGFGHYDVEQLTLTAIWQEEDRTVAMFSTPEDTVFIVNIGEEAYDGRIVEISLDGGYVKFLQELRRSGGRPRPGEPDVKYEEKIVRFRR